jgi:hypothetical protein
MNGPHEDVPPENGGEQSFDREQHRNSTNTTVPPPAQHEIDALVDAVSAGHRAHVGTRSGRVSVADDAAGAARAPRPRDRHETARVILPRAMRVVAGSLAAFALGVLITWSVVRRFDAPPPTPAVVSTPLQPPSVDVPVAVMPAVPSTQPAPVAPPAAPITRPAPRESAPLPPARAVEPRRAAIPEPPSPVVPVLPPAPVPEPDARAAAPSAAPAAAPVPLLASPAIAAAPPAAVALAAVVTPPRTTDMDQAAVIAAVREYEQAYEKMDVSATAAVWPSVDRRELTRAFGTLKSQALDLRNCEVTIAQSQATARCRGTVAYVPKIGSSTPRTGRQEWIFRMRKIGDTWVIDGLDASPIA